MKAKRLSIQNIGIIADAVIELNKPLIVFFGEICQGKSTLLNAMKWVVGGAFPADIIRHGQDEAFIEFEFDGGTIRREFYRNKKGEVDARPLTFIRDGKVVPKPVDEIKKILNPFMLDQDYFVKMNERQRQLYLVEALGADTADIDRQIEIEELAATGVRSELARIGVPTPVPEVPAPDVSALQAQRTAAVETYKAALQTVQQAKQTAEDRARKLQDLERQAQQSQAARKVVATAVEACSARAVLDRLTKAKAEMDELESRLQAEENARLETVRVEFKHKRETLYEAFTEQRAAIERDGEKRRAEAQEALRTLDATDARINDEARAVAPEVAVPAEPVLDTQAIDAQIGEAGLLQAAAQRYADFKAQRDRRQRQQILLDSHETKLRELRNARRKTLSTLATSCPVQGLTFDEAGQVMFEGTLMSMISTSQLMRLSSQLSALYPADLGVELLDRAESLGKSIWTLIDKATKDQRTILAAVVGDKPAVVPENVGVFVVENGAVK